MVHAFCVCDQRERWGIQKFRNVQKPQKRTASNLGVHGSLHNSRSNEGSYSDLGFHGAETTLVRLNVQGVREQRTEVVVQYRAQQARSRQKGFRRFALSGDFLNLGGGIIELHVSNSVCTQQLLSPHPYTILHYTPLSLTTSACLCVLCEQGTSGGGLVIHCYFQVPCPPFWCAPTVSI